MCKYYIQCGFQLSHSSYIYSNIMELSTLSSNVTLLRHFMAQLCIPVHTCSRLSAYVGYYIIINNPYKLKHSKSY